MGIFDKRREQLGIKTAAPSTKPSSGGSSSVSAFERRRASLQQEQEDRRQDSIRRSEKKPVVTSQKPTLQLPSIQQQLQTATTAFTPQSVNKDLRPTFGPPKPTLQDRFDSEIAKNREAAAGNPVSNILNRLSEPITALQLLTEKPAKVAEQFYTPAMGPTALLGVSKFIGTGLSKISPVLGNSSKALPTITREVIKEAGVGALAGAGQSLAYNPQGGLTEAANQAKWGALFGGGGAGLITGGIKGAGAVAQRVGEDAIGSMLQSSKAIQQAGDSVSTGPLKFGNNETYVNKAMSDIKPIVFERMTPPLENPNELAKWLKPHIGDVSLNDMRKLSYEDMRQLATEVQNGMDMLTIAKQAAKERGYDLDSLLSGNTPSVSKEVDRLRMGNVAGAIEPPQNARFAISNNDVPTPNAEPSQQGWLSRLFGDSNLGISPFGSNNSGRIVSTDQQIVNNPLKTNIKGLAGSTKQAARSAYQNTTDFLSPLKKINRQTYDAAMDASRTNNMANTIIRDKFVDLEGNVIGSSLNDIMKQTRGLGKKVDDYLVLRHAITRMERGERVYDAALQMTPDKARAAIQTLETRYPALKGVGEEWDNYNANLLDSGVREGLISEAARDAMRRDNPNYASMRRQFTLGEKMAQPKWGSGGSSFSGQRAPINQVSPTGSTRKIVTPLRSAIEQTYAWKNAELRNRSMQEIVKSIQADPEGMKGIVEIIKKPSTSYKSLDDALREGGSEEFLELLDNDFKSLFKKNASGDENIVRAMVNGTPVYVKVNDPEAVKALLGLGSEQAGIILQAMQTLSNATKRGATGLLAPMFAIKSLTADTVQAAIQSPNAFKHIVIDAPHALFSSLGDILRIPGLKNLAEDFRRSGGEYSALLRGDRKVNTAIGDMRRYPLLSPQSLAKGAVSTVKAPFKAFEKVADASENVNRMAAFRRALKGKERTPENVRKAINAARESTVNFSRKGAWTREAEAFAPYSNAAVQGIYRLNKAFIKNPVKTLAGLTTLVVAPKLYEYAKFNDDPDYQKLPARERYRHIIISKNKDGTFNKQFMPPEYLAFGAFITDVLNDVVNQDPQAYKGTMSSIVNAFTPPLASGSLQGVTQGGGVEQSLKGFFNSTVLAPAQALIGNQSFTGAPIVPQRLAGLSAKNQYDERTSSPAKFIGEKIGMSPIKVDYLIRAYGGDPARLLLPLTSDAGGGTTRNTLLKNFIVDPVFTNTLADDYFTAKESLSMVRNDNKSMGDELPSWYTDAAYELANSTKKGSPAKLLTELNAEKRTVTGDKTLSGIAKSKRLRDIQFKINNIYLDINTKLQDAGVPMPRR